MSQHEQQPDPLDVEAAEIDARSPDAPEQVEALIEHAEALGRDPEHEVVTDPPTSGSTRDADGS